MLKKAFTLQELLITMGIIGVISALALPAIMNAQPDKNKSLYMRAYNSLTTLTADIIDNSELYWTEYNADGSISHKGLSNVTKLDFAPYNKIENSVGVADICSGIAKYPIILYSMLNTASTPTIAVGNPSTVSFSTTDGMSWSFEADPTKIASNKLEYTLTIDVNDTEGINHIYDDDHTQPDQFMFVINNEGDIQPADALGMAYLQSATDMTSKAEDKELASQIISSAGSSTDVAKMTSALNTIIKSKSKSK